MTSEPDYLVFDADFGESLILGGLDWYYPDDDGMSDEESEATYEERSAQGKARVAAFYEEFDFLGEEFLGDPDEDWYQGVNFTTVIRRKSDGKLFGYTYWKPVAKYGEAYVEANCEDIGHDDYRHYVFAPVRPFTVQGYAVDRLEDAS